MTISAVAFSLVYVEIKNWAMGKIPTTQEFKEAWSEWEVRCFVVLSLALQLLLILSAYARQKYKGRFLPYVAAIVWSIYMAADWVATLSMTTILRGTFAEESAVVVLWVPFLLWHLGSPANITAYSLEDNELWLRHFLGLASNGVEAGYIHIKFRTAGAPIYGSLYVLDLMVVTLLVGGILKYAERIVALRSASSEQLRNDLYSEAKRSQQRSKGGGMIRTGLYESSPTVTNEMNRDPQVTFLRESQESFEIFRPLFLDLPFEVSNKYHEERVFLRNKSAEEAFRLVNIELQFLYDLFYTKIPIQYRYCKLNAFLRGFYIFSTLSVLIVFTTRNSIGGTSKREVSKVDIVVTYLLLVGATSLDAFAALLHLRSNWTMIRFGKLRNCWLVASKLRSIASKSGMPKIAQYDILKDFAFKPWPGIFESFVNFIDTNEVLSKYRLTTWTKVDIDLRKFIYDGLEKELRRTLSCNVPETLIVDLDASLWPYLEHGKDKNKQMPTSLTRAIFICHVTTKLIYYSAEQPDGSPLSRMSNVLSDYMMFLVLVHPKMLPKDFGDMTKESFVPDNKRADLIRKESRRAAFLFGFARNFERSHIEDPKFFARELLDNEGTEISNLLVLKELDVLSMGHKFARKLRGSWDNDGDIWGLLSDLWMIMLIHAAKQCSWKEHAVALRNGAELLTHVSLLLAHFGLSQHIRVLDDIKNHSV